MTPDKPNQTQPQIRYRGVTNHYEGLVKPSESGDIQHKPFCLEDKKQIGILTHTNQRQYGFYSEDKIKQAVKLLKEEINEDRYISSENSENVINKIDKIFGSGLTNG